MGREMVYSFEHKFVHSFRLFEIYFKYILHRFYKHYDLLGSTIFFLHL